MGIVGARPVEREVGLEDLGVRVRLHALVDGGSYCTPTASHQWRIWEPGAVRRRGLSSGVPREKL